MLCLGASAAFAPRVGFSGLDEQTSGLAAYFAAFGSVAAVVVAVAAAAPDLGRGAVVVTVCCAALLAGGSAGIDEGPAGAIAVLVLLLAGGTAAGAAIGARIEHAGHLGPVAIVSSIADVASVLVPGAPSQQVAESAPLLSRLAISWPLVGTRVIAPILGVGDVVFVALYLSASRRHGLGVARTGTALALGLACTAIAVAVLAQPVPALPFLAAAMLIAHREARTPPERDRRAAVIGIVATASIALVAWWVRAR